MGHGIEWLLVLACLLHQHSEIRDLVSCPDTISEYGVCGSQDGQTALHAASRVVNRIHQLAPVCRMQDGQTALHVASRVVNLIHQLTPVCRVQDGQTALHVASRVVNNRIHQLAPVCRVQDSQTTAARG